MWVYSVQVFESTHSKIKIQNGLEYLYIKLKNI
jgi:hypothetical protein